MLTCRRYDSKAGLFFDYNPKLNRSVVLYYTSNVLHTATRRGDTTASEAYGSTVIEHQQPGNTVPAACCQLLRTELQCLTLVSEEAPPTTD